MKSLYSEAFDVTVTANMITRHNQTIVDVTDLLKEYDQLSIVKTGLDTFDITAPMDEQDHFTFSALIHRLNSENKLNKKVDTNGKGPDNDGPKPTNPRGSGGHIVEQKEIYAVAA